MYHVVAQYFVPIKEHCRTQAHRNMIHFGAYTCDHVFLTSSIPVQRIVIELHQEPLLPVLLPGQIQVANV